MMVEKADVIHLSRFGKWFLEYEILYMMSRYGERNTRMSIGTSLSFHNIARFLQSTNMRVSP